jgi:hypothetical protein
MGDSGVASGRLLESGEVERRRCENAVLCRKPLNQLHVGGQLAHIVKKGQPLIRYLSRRQEARLARCAHQGRVGMAQRLSWGLRRAREGGFDRERERANGDREREREFERKRERLRLRLRLRLRERERERERERDGHCRYSHT